MIYTDAGYPGGGCVFIPICQTGAYTVIHEFYPFFWENHPWGPGGSNANAFFLNWGADYGDNIHDSFLGHEGDFTSYNNSYSGYYTFTLVRCPYDRMISGYKFVPSLASQAFGTVCANLPARNTNFDQHNRKYNFPYRMVTKTQRKTLWNLDSNIEIACDYVMRYESIQQDWDHVCDALGRSRSPLNMKLSTWLDCAPVYSCDKTTYFTYTTYPGTLGTNRTNISSSFGEDFKKYGYVLGNETYPSTNLESVWRFENNFDDALNNHDLSPNHTYSQQWSTGIPLGGGNCLDASAIGDGSETTFGSAAISGTDFEGSSHTFTLWFKCPDRSVNQTLVDYSNADGGLILRIYNGRLKYMIGGNSGTWSALTSSLRITNNKWHFVSFRHDIVNAYMKLTLDGTTYTTTGSYSLNAGTTDPTFYIGKENWGNQSNCKIDEVSWHQDYLSNDDIKILYNNGDGRYYV